MSEHSPGPWVVARTASGTGIICEDRNGAWIAFLPEDSTGEADARLIAAAPDLLAALEAVLEWDEPGPFGLVQELLDQCQAAIKKARGE